LQQEPLLFLLVPEQLSLAGTGAGLAATLAGAAFLAGAGATFFGAAFLGAGLEATFLAGTAF
jgi:hypothetical protein